MGGQDAADGPDTPDQERPLRVRLPLEYHLRLHRLRLYSGKTIAEVVRHALDAELAAEESRLGRGPAGDIDLPEAL